MERTFTVGGRVRRVEFFEELAALRPTTSEGRDRLAAGACGTPIDLSEWFSGADDGLARTDAEAFQAAGWFFIRAESGQLEKLAQVPGIGVGRVFRDEVGHLAIGVGRMTVKFRADLSEDEALATLDRAHVQVVRKLRFAPNLYEVRAAAAADELDTIKELQSERSVEFAEPQMVEHVKRREELPPISPTSS